MSFTYDTTTSLGRVRMLITDRDEANLIFQDAEIEAFLAMEGDDVFQGAALALETIAVSEVLVLKVIEIIGLKTDGASVARELRQRAKALRDKGEESAFAIAEMIDSPSAWQEKLLKDAMRSGAS